MKATLDGIIVLQEQHLKVGSWRREAVERAVAGLDGVLSIDLGMRSRVLVQKGTLRAVSAEGLSGKIDAVSALMDGGLHTLVKQDGEQFDNLRMDAFEVDGKNHSGTGTECGFEIRYTQVKS